MYTREKIYVHSTYVLAYHIWYNISVVYFCVLT